MRFVSFVCALVLSGALALSLAPRLEAATKEATAAATALDQFGPPGPKVEALTRAIDLERAAPAPDAAFLLWTTQRLGALYAADPPDGLGDRRKAIALARHVLGLVDAAVAARRQSRVLFIGPTPQLIKYQLLGSLARWQLQRLVDRHPGATVVAVSHADPIKAAVAHALGSVGNTKALIGGRADPRGRGRAAAERPLPPEPEARACAPRPG